MSRFALALCSVVTACVPAVTVPRVSHVGVAADVAAPAVTAEPAVSVVPSGSEPVVEEVAEEPPVAAGPLIVGGEVGGALASDEVRKLPFRAPKGHYLVELFVKAPQHHQCNGAPGADVTVVDRDEARIGSVFGTSTWNHDHWDKRQETFDLPGGGYQVTLLAHKGCRVYVRVRLSPAP